MRYFLILSLCFLVSGCRKDPEVQAPSITISSPVEGSLVTAGETITVEGSVLSLEELDAVTLNFLDEDRTAVLPARNISHQGKAAVFHEEFPTTTNLEGGVYYIQVIATSRGKRTSRYVRLNLYGSPAGQDTYYVITSDNSSTVLSKVDSTSSTPFTLTTFNGQYYSSARAGDLIGISFYNYDLQAFSISSGTIAWSLPRYNNPQITFRGVHGTSDLLYVSQAQDQLVRGYDAQKIAKYTAYLPATHYPDDVFVEGDLVFVDEHPLWTADEQKLSVKYRVSGAGLQEIETGFDIVRILPKSADELYVFGKDSQVAYMYIYNVPANVFNSVHALPIAGLLDAVRVNSDDLLIMNENEILSYRYSTNSLVPYLSFTGRCMKYDVGSNEMIVGVGNEMRIYNYNTKQLKRTVTFSATVLDIIPVSE